MLRRLLALVLAGGLALALTPTPASAVLTLDRAYDLLTKPGPVPACWDMSVLGRVANGFAHADAEVLKRGLSIVGVEKIRETYLWADNPSPIVRRFCEAHAILNDGHKTAVYYMIEQDLGLFTLTYNVEFCLIGYEPWRVHDGQCRTVRKWW